MEQAVASLQQQVQQLQANLNESHMQTQRLSTESAQAIATLTAQLEAHRVGPGSVNRTALKDTRMLTNPMQFSGKPED